MGWLSERVSLGFSLVELLLVVAIFATLSATALPVYNDLAEVSRLSSATREVERELQAARLKSVSTNRMLRVRLNCPVAGEFRTVEVLGTGADTAIDRCTTASYPYPAADQNRFTRPNFDGPIRRLSQQTTMTNGAIEFRPDGTAWDVSTGTPQAIGTTVSFTVTRRTRTRTVTVNAMGKIQMP